MTAPDPALALEEAVAVLRSGGVIAIPTDTLYALVAVATDAAAVDRVYAIKGREDGKPMPLFVKDVAMAERYGRFDDAARRLAQRFWPGPLTIVVEKQADFESLALAGGNTVALRAPEHRLVIDLLGAIDQPVTGTSANRSGGRDPVTADDVRAQIGDEVDLVIDGGACPLGVSSTIVACLGDEVTVLRRGVIDEEQVRAVLAPAPSELP
jgi:L-threonylcarbamoyladenylate synthase